MSKYEEMKEDKSQEVFPESNLPKDVPVNSELQKHFKLFNKTKTFDKLHAFVDWVELDKLPQTKAVYNQLKDYQFYEDTALVNQLEDKVIGLDFSPINQKIIVLLENAVIIVINSKNGAIVERYEFDEEYYFEDISCLTVTDSKIFVGCDNGDIISLNYTDKIILDEPLKGHKNTITALSFNKAENYLVQVNSYLVSGDSNGEVYIWDVSKEGSPSRNFMNSEGESVNALLITPDKEKIIAAGDDTRIRIWSFKDLTLLDTFEGHDESISALAISSNGECLASAGGDKIVKIWDLKQKKEKFSLEGHEEDITCLVFLPNGKTVVSGSEDNSIRIWSAVKGTHKYTITGHAGAINCFTIYNKKALLISGSADRTIRGWNLDQFRNTNALSGSQAPVLALAAIPNSSFVISGGEEKIIRVWHLDEAMKIEELDSNTTKTLSLDVNKNGTMFAAGGIDGVISLWDIDLNNLKFTKRFVSYKHIEGVSALKFTKNGEFLVSGSLNENQSLKIWDLTLTQVNELKKHPGIISTLCLTSDDTQIITGTRFSGLYIWDFKTLKNITSLKGHEGEITAVKTTSDYKLVSACKDCSIKIWSLTTHNLIQTLLHEKSVLSFEITPDEKRIISGSEDKTLRIWEVSTGRQVGIAINYIEPLRAITIEADGYRVISSGIANFSLKIVDINKIKTTKILGDYTKGLHSIALSPDQNLLATGDAAHNIRIWDMNTYKYYPELKGHVSLVNKLKFTKDGKKLISCGRDNSARIWDLKNPENGQLIKIIRQFSNAVRDVEFYDNENKAIFACYSGALLFYNMISLEIIENIDLKVDKNVTSLAVDQSSQKVYVGSGNFILIYDLKMKEFLSILGKHDDIVSALVLTPKNDRLITCSFDMMIKVWDLKENKLLSTMKGHTKPIKCLALNNYGNKLFSSGADESIQIWDLNNFKRLAVFDGSSEEITALVLNKDNSRLYSASLDKTVRFWDIEDSKFCPFYEGHFGDINHIKITPDGKYIISTSDDFNIIIWDWKEGKQIAKLKGYSVCVNGLAITSNGSKLITCSIRSNIRIWGLKKQREIANLGFETGTAARVVILTPDDKEFILGCCDSTLKVYSMETHFLVKKFEEGHNSEIFAVILSKDSRKLISAGKDQLIVIWNYQTTKQINILSGHENYINSLCFFYGKQDVKLLSGSDDGTVKIWNLESAILENTIEISGFVTGIIQTRDNKRLIFSSNQQIISIYDSETLEEINSLNFVDFPVYDILLTPKENQLIAAGGQTISVWNFDTNFDYQRGFSGFSPIITCQIVSPNRKMVIIAAADFEIRVWDFEKGLVGNYREHKNEITALIMTSDNDRLISASKDRTILVYSVIEHSIVSRIKAHSSFINALAFTKDENNLISASEDNTIKIWNITSESLIREFETNDENVLALAILGNDLKFLAGGIEKKLNLWDINTGKYETVAILPKKIKGLMLSPDNQILIIYLENSMMQIWKTLDYSFISEMEIRDGNFTVFPVFLNKNNNPLMLYYEKLIGCMNGETIFNFEPSREMKYFFFDYETNKYYYITSQFELYMVEEYWFQTYIYEYLKYDSITTLAKDPEKFIKRQLSNYPFSLSFLHLITIFEKSEYFSKEQMEEIYNGKVDLSYFFYLDIFMNTPLDIMILKKNTTLMNKYFYIFFSYFDQDNANFFQKVRFLNYSFKENYDIRNLMIDIIDLCEPDLSIISKIFDYAFMPLDNSIYDNSLVFKEFDDPIFIGTSSIYKSGKEFIQTKTKEFFIKSGAMKSVILKRERVNKINEEEEKQSMVNAKVLCLPWICDLSSDTTEMLFCKLANLEPDNEIFGNKNLQMLADYIWVSQIKFYFLAEFIIFFFFFALYNINFIYLYPLRNNIYYDNYDVLKILGNLTFTIDGLLFFYGIFSFINEMRQMNASGFSEYFKSIWNYFDILLIPLLLITTFNDILRGIPDLLSEDILLAIKVVSALCMFCFWFRFLSFFRGISETSSMIRLIFNVITSTRYFLLFMVISMLNLSCTFYLLHTDNLDEDPEFWSVFLVFYEGTVGDTSGITDYDLAISQLSDFFMIFSTFLFAIILLNLLVSIIGDIHGEIKEAGAKTRLYELINILVDTNFASTSKIIRLFRGEVIEDKYLIQLYNQKHDEIEENVYEALEKRIEEKMVTINKENEKSIKKIDEKIDKLNEKMEKLFENGWDQVKEYLKKEEMKK